ncbi:glutamyl-tRNA reductase [Propionibacterium cyclohexanicum]|uniref:Glutamyl-tRNA reductase n=1 Tax=Propionibacterium cyclohexanicum TaxID=64702 RepID=A0A1H9SUM7_9ACTN|nr:hypothetical protein [Propionibacterium cyclohexanicum]SER88690.1 glutamyl-tRNA reductase [Propionibacterium cyclohexanicum]
MHIHVVGVDHESASLSALASVGPADALAARVMAREPAIAGAVLLSTCNRFELVTDVCDGTDADTVLALVRRELEALCPQVDPLMLAGLSVTSDEAAVRHLFTVGAGLLSAVIGDKQVAGQLRRAYESASERGQCTARLHRLFHSCLHTSRTVASTTSLGAVGRSAAGVGLDLATRGRADLRGTRVLLVGTGSFARVVVAELVSRRAKEIMCWSASGRAPEFAAHHQVRPVPGGSLVAALREAQLVVTCSGNGVVLDEQTVLAARPELAAPAVADFPVVDLSLAGDVAASVAQLPGVRVVSLAEVVAKANGTQAEVIEEAQRVVEHGVREYLAKERSRAADPLVAALRQHVAMLVDAEIARCHAKESEEVAAAVERSLRHAAGALLHTPMVRVSQLVEQGRLEECTEALATLFGIEVEQ